MQRLRTSVMDGSGKVQPVLGNISRRGRSHVARGHEASKMVFPRTFRARARFSSFSTAPQSRANREKGKRFARTCHCGTWVEMTPIWLRTPSTRNYAVFAFENHAVIHRSSMLYKTPPQRRSVCRTICHESNYIPRIMAHRGCYHIFPSSSSSCPKISIPTRFLPSSVDDYTALDPLLVCRVRTQTYP